MKSLEDHGVWEKENVLKDATVLPTRFVFDIKRNSNGSINRYKARLIAKGFAQGIVDETYSPVVSFTTIRTAIAFAVQRKMVVHQMDVKTAFLHGEIDDLIYVTPPPGLNICRKGESMRLKKGLYGLKQASRLWNSKWSDIMIKFGFNSLTSDECAFTNGKLWLFLYVEDLIIIGKEIQEIEKQKEKLVKELNMKDMGTLSFFLGIRFKFENGTVQMDQSGYIQTFLQRFNMENCNRAPTPMTEGFCITGKGEKFDSKLYREAVGSLLYIATKTRSDISYAVGLLARACEAPTEREWVVVKRVLRYLRGTQNQRLTLYYTAGGLHGYSDADWAGDVHTRRSTSGYLFFLGKSLISWKSCRQKSVALSSSEAELSALSEACKEAVWLKSLLQELETGLAVQSKLTIYVDNQTAISWGENGVRRAKHISIRQNYVKKQVDRGTISLVYTPSENILADFLTKPLGRVNFGLKVSRVFKFSLSMQTDTTSCV